MPGDGRYAEAKTAEQARCSGCVHYFITYDPNFPYGCRALSFKSRMMPCKEVEAASGLPCQMFQPRIGTR